MIAQNALNVVQVLSPIAVHISLEETFWFVRFRCFWFVLFCHHCGKPEHAAKDRIREDNYMNKEIYAHR